MEETPLVSENLSFIAKHRFLVLVVIAIIVSLFLVVISMAIYNRSGAAQLDLSRPGYRSISSEAVTNDNSFQVFPSSGTVTKSTVDDFIRLFDTQTKSVYSFDAYGGDPLSADALEISAPPTTSP